MDYPARPSARPVPARDRHRGIELGPEHTRVPNQLLDLVIPRLTPGEQSCLLYILRRTYGYASPTVKGQRKQWDRIALSQFIDGTRSGGYVLDLGTEMSRTAVINSLGRLEERGLVRVSYECPTVLKKGKAVGCGWNESDDDHLTQPVIDPKTNAHKCPRCRRTLSKAYALRTLTPGWIKRFLTATDPGQRQWNYDPEVGRFYLVDENESEAKEKAKQTQLERDRRRAQELREQLWFPELVDQVIGQALSKLKSGKMAESRVIGGFLSPAVVMQDQYPRQALEHGLKEVVRRGIAGKPGRDEGWQNYTKRVVENYLTENAGKGKNTEQAVTQASVENELARCAELNREGQREQARQALHDLLGRHLDKVTGNFSGDRPLARRHLLEAFKRGIDDYEYARDYTVTVDFLPEWTWEDDEERNG